MTTSAAIRESAQTRLPRGAAAWLALAASPTFAVMAWIAANDASAMAMCGSGSSLLPVDGMTAMYGLMGLFHLTPWLKLASGRARAAD